MISIVLQTCVKISFDLIFFTETFPCEKQSRWVYIEGFQLTSIFVVVVVLPNYGKDIGVHPRYDGSSKAFWLR